MLLHVAVQFERWGDAAMAKTTAAQRRLEAELDVAENLESCLVPRTHADDVALKRRLSKGEIIMPASSVFIRSSRWQNLSRSDRALYLMRALSEKHPSWVFRGSSAVLARGLEIPNEMVFPVKVYAGRSPARASDLIEVARPPKAFELKTEVLPDGIRVPTFWESVLECLLDAPFSKGLVVADSALRRTGWTAGRLEECVRSTGRNRPGVRRAVLIARFADGRAESGGESRIRAFFIEHGYRLPDLQVEIVDPVDSRRVFRVDFIWYLEDGRVIVGEFDGRCKFEDETMLLGRAPAEVFAQAQQRESRLTLAGCEVLRFAYDDLVHPERLERMLAVAGIPKDAGAERAWQREWAGVQA